MLTKSTPPLYYSSVPPTKIRFCRIFIWIFWQRVYLRPRPRKPAYKKNPPPPPNRGTVLIKKGVRWQGLSTIKKDSNKINQGEGREGEG